MTTLREAAQLALEYIRWQAFGECRIGEGPIPEAKDVVRALRKALAEPEQPARVPLTDAQIECITSDNSLDTIHAVVRAVEAAHGIKPLCFGPYDPEDDQR